ncbi:MAG TPA: hypothetical protein VE978_21585 [Chitinophagales bacterium]|nr:hypothetical protein [Chitinophagales bacterium]
MKKRKSSSQFELKKQLQSLRSICNVFDEQALMKKKQLLSEISLSKLNQPKKLFEYHQLLLFLSAYPQSKELLLLAEKELHRVAASAKEIFDGKNERLRTQLVNTGIANTQLNISFSFHFVNWLLEEFHEDVKLFSIDADDTTVEQVLCACLPAIERDLIADKMMSATQMIHRLKSDKQNDLEFLVQLFGNAEVSVEVRDALWDSLKIFISWRLKTNSPSLTSGRSPARKTFFHTTPLLKKFEPQKTIQKFVDPPYKLNQNEKKQLVAAGRGVLAMLLRETDPVTYAYENAVELFDAGRGIDIALYPMIPERRLPLESYIGYVAFKNRIPVAYGGGWIFLHRSKIGLNVLPAFRGGESSFLFTQILRVYHHHFNMKKFIVEPYQIGKNNLEGLKSGAFWFYYRLGFRPSSEKLSGIATREFEMISAEKNYRTPLSVMRQLANSNLELNLSPEKYFPDSDPISISKSAKELFSTQKLKRRRHYSDTSDFIVAANKLRKKEASLLKKIFAQKYGGSERDFIFSLQKNHKLIEVETS